MTAYIIQGLNLLLAAAMYTLAGRYLMSLFFKPNSPQVIWRVFVQVTDPIVATVRYVTPRLIADPLIPLLAVVWIVILRMALFLVMATVFGGANSGVTP